MTSPSVLNVPNRNARPASVDGLRLNEILTDVLPLLESAQSDETFFAPFLEKVSRITHAEASALWMRTPRGSFERAFDHQWQKALDTDANHAAHPLLLEEAAAMMRTVWQQLPADRLALPTQESPNSDPCLNRSRLAFLFAPVLIGRKLAGLLEIVLPIPTDRDLKKLLTRLATELAGVAAAFLQKREWVQLQEAHGFACSLQNVAAQLHQSLVPTEVAFVLAHEGKKLSACDQLSVAIQQNRQMQLASVSGALSLEANSPHVRALIELARAVAAWGEILSFEGQRDPSLPPGVLLALDSYLALSNPLTMVALPVKATDGEVVGVLLAESFERSQPAAKIRSRLEALSRHAGLALQNAQTHDRLPLKWFTRPLADLRSTKGSSLRRWAFRLGVLALVAALVVGIRLPRRMEATGNLVPGDRRIVYAARSGKVLHLSVKHGDRVEKGQELLFIEDLETQLKADQLLVKMTSFDQKIAFLDEQLSKNLPQKERADLLSERIQASYELSRAKVERDLLLSETRNPRKAAVVSPLAGRVVTFDPSEKLIGKSLKPGDPLIRIADVSGSWEVELFLPENNISPIREALASTASLEVQLMVSSDPYRTYTGQLTLEGLGGETIVREDRVVLPARVTLTDRTLISQLASMPVGVEVQARIHCGTAPAGVIWFGEICDFVYRRFLF